MESEFAITCRQSSGNLHVGITGLFTEDCAESLRSLILREYPGSGRVFVETRTLTGVRREGADHFRKDCGPFGMDLSDLYFKGENGFAIAPEGSRVLVFNKPEKISNGRSPCSPGHPAHEHKCCGRCAHCTCGGHKHDHDLEHP